MRLDHAGFHGAQAAQFRFDVGVFLGDVVGGDLLGFEVAQGAELEDHAVEVVRRDAHDDGAADFAVGEFVGTGGGDVAAFFGDDGGDGGGGAIEGDDFEFHGAVADDFALGDFRGGGVGGGGLGCGGDGRCGTGCCGDVACCREKPWCRTAVSFAGADVGHGNLDDVEWSGSALCRSVDGLQIRDRRNLGVTDGRFVLAEVSGAEARRPAAAPASCTADAKATVARGDGLILDSVLDGPVEVGVEILLRLIMAFAGGDRGLFGLAGELSGLLALPPLLALTFEVLLG